VFRIVAVRHFPSGTCLHTPATAVSIFWTASARRGSVASAWTAFYALANLPAVFVHDRVLAPAPQAPSPGTLAFDTTMRGESDRVRRVNVP
jgi:hypothetical protein